MSARPVREPEGAAAAPEGLLAKPLNPAGKPATQDDAAEAKAKAQVERAAIERWEAEGGRTLLAQHR